jgi:hypothetical protein
LPISKFRDSCRVDWSAAERLVAGVALTALAAWAACGGRGSFVDYLDETFAALDSALGQAARPAAR